VSIRRKEAESRYHPYSSSMGPAGSGPESRAPSPETEPINLEMPKPVFNIGELTIVRRAPSPPQDEPMDFSTKKNTETIRLPTYTSTKELRFAKNLKLLLVEIMRKDSAKAKVILSYLRHSWKKSKTCSTTTNSDGATGQQPQDGQGGTGSNAGGSSAGASGGGSSGGGGGSGSGSGGNGHYGGSGEAGGGSGCTGSSGSGNNDGGDGNNRRNVNNNNNNKGSILDMELDFDELRPRPANSNTSKWFQEHPDINAGKILDGLLSLKTEFPDDSSNGSHSVELKPPPDMGALDHATANLLQMSVPDPSTTFLDIGTDIGGTSLYEDDPFNLEHLLPSNFNINQLDLLPSSPDHHHQLGPHSSQHLLTAHGSEASMSITTKNILENNNSSHNLSLQPPGSSSMTQHHLQQHPSGSLLPSAIGMSLYPETTIRPMELPLSGGHFRTLEPMALKGIIKTEPVAYIKRESDNNNAGMMQLHPPHHHHYTHQLLHDSYSHHTPGVSPISSVSMGSPGSPPMSLALHEKNQAAMAIASLAGGGSSRGGGPNHHNHQQPGGGKMKSSPSGMPSSSSGSGRKKSQPASTPEEDELASIPSLQMRIKILQQRVSIASRCKK
jgi:hypothetical protein